ncbi:MAG: histidinol-phosphate transaminase [Candidatus Omnitrophica bacterium]|nr:histidinol-phosphate transaminase [Candidatus Omnitrophota bacterium]
MKSRANKNILKIKPYVPGKPIEDVKRDFGLKNVIKLASNENPYGPSPKVLKAIAQEAKSLNRYPDGSCFLLRQELSKRFKVSPEQLVFGCGSDETIVLALRAFVNEGDEVVMAKPSFLVYSIASTAVGATLREVPLKGLRYDLPAMKQAVSSKTKIVFIGNPDNPSGQYPTKIEISEFLNGFPDEVLVFFDEAYFEFASSQKDYADTLALLKTRKNIIVARTFSKIYGLAGLRIGYAIASSEVADLMNRVREPFNVTSLAQVAAMAALKDSAYYKRILKELDRERERVCKALGELGVEVSQGCTNFIQVKVPRDSREIALALMKKGVIIRDMSVWGLENYIRVTIGRPTENGKFLKALREVLQKA